MKRMKQMKRISLAVACGAAIALLAGNNAAMASVAIIDYGPTPPVPGTSPGTYAYDAFMTDNGVTSFGGDFPAGEPPGLNYYSNGGGGGTYPGQIFTVPANQPGGDGYALGDIYLTLWGGAGGDILGTMEPWFLYLYSYNSATTNATLLGTYTGSFALNNQEDWVQVSGIHFALTAGQDYAYSFENGGDGWVYLGAEDPGTTGVPAGYSSSLYSGGVNGGGSLINADNQPVLIPQNGGVVNFPNAGGTPPVLSPGWVAQFDIGLTPIVGSTILVNPPSIVTPGNVYPVQINAFATGTAVTMNSGTAYGQGTIGYQWLWDGGVPGAPVTTPAPGASTGSTYVYTGTTVGTYNFAVRINNGVLHGTDTSAAVTLVFANPTQTVPLVDEFGTNVSAPHYLTLYQTNAGGSGDGLNYYDNDIDAPPGEIFTIPTANAAGYTLTSLQLGTGQSAGTENNINVEQPYGLFIYQLNSAMNYAQLVQVYSNASFAWSSLGDWLQWTFPPGQQITLQAGATYAYTFENGNNGWAAMADTATPAPTYFGGTTSPVAQSTTGNMDCEVSIQNGALTLGTGAESGTFVLGLSAVGQPPVAYPYANAIVETVTGNSQQVIGAELVGTSITLTENAMGAAPLGYTWLWDAGTGATPLVAYDAGPDSSVLNLNTAGWTPGLYTFAVKVANGSGSITSVPLVVSLSGVNSTAVISDAGGNPPTPGPLDIYQLTVGTQGTPPGLNYYFDNASPPGNTFFTGSSALGYYLNNVYVDLNGGDGGLPAAPGQDYILRIYGINASGTPGLDATYTSQQFLITTGVNDTNWVEIVPPQPLPLKPNAEYAFTFGRDHSQTYDGGWDSLGSAVNPLTPASANGPTSTASAVTVNPGGGVNSLTPTSTAGQNGAFDIGLSSGSITLSIQKNANGSVTITWSPALGTLQYETTIAGPWIPINGASSPYTTSPSGSERIYSVVYP